MTEDLISIFLNSVFAGNILLAYFLGMCSFVAVSKNINTAIGLGFAVALDQGVIGEIGSPGEYNWGGAAGTRFWIDPAEDLIGIFMVQSIPHRTRLARTFKVLTYQAIVE